jgi:hypothetical protein
MPEGGMWQHTSLAAGAGSESPVRRQHMVALHLWRCGFGGVVGCTPVTCSLAVLVSCIAILQ